MPAPTMRDQIRGAMETLPPNATFDDAIERLVFLAKIETDSLSSTPVRAFPTTRSSGASACDRTDVVAAGATRS